MAQAVETYEQYETDFRKLQEQRAGKEPQWLTDLRDSGFERFLQFRFPVERKGNEGWKYTDVRPIARGSFDYPFDRAEVSASALAARLPFDSGFIRIALVDGHFAPELSTGLDAPGIVVAPLSEAVRSQPQLVEAHLGKYAQVNHDSFVGVNTAMHSDGAFIHAAQAVKTPVHVVYLTSDRGNPVTFPRALVVASALNELTLVESYISLGDQNHFTDAVTEITLEDGATVDHYRLLLENPNAFHVGHVRVNQGRDTNYANLSYETGGGLVRVDTDVLFDDTGSSAALRGLYVTSGDQHIDNLVTIDHAKPHNTSRLYYKGILDGSSKAVFGGTVFVRPGADKTDAYQEDKNLLLSREAEVDSKPALEIYADDVKCGHGATAGAIAEDALFYMQSRGIDPEQAMLFLVRGFASEILDGVKLAALRTWLDERTTLALPRFGERAG
ncbi:MAG: Fe-S cluster assembly protein SufD [Dehalococcoidia bacterium]